MLSKPNKATSHRRTEVDPSFVKENATADHWLYYILSLTSAALIGLDQLPLVKLLYDWPPWGTWMCSRPFTYSEPSKHGFAGRSRVPGVIINLALKHIDN